MNYFVAGALKGQKLCAEPQCLAKHIPAAKIKAPSKRPTINFIPEPQPHPQPLAFVEQQPSSFFSSDILFSPYRTPPYGPSAQAEQLLIN